MLNSKSFTSSTQEALYSFLSQRFGSCQLISGDLAKRVIPSDEQCNAVVAIVPRR
ncbi:MAG: hypothetical protein AB8A37_05610 [Prochlorococcus sp.]